MNKEMLKELKKAKTVHDRTLKLNTRFSFLLDCLIRDYEQQVEGNEYLKMKYESTGSIFNRQFVKSELDKQIVANKNLEKLAERYKGEVEELVKELEQYE